MEVVLIILAVTAGLGAAIEVLLRVLLGFGNPLIYIADAECGYLLAPSQKVRRLGNRIEINEYSMRSRAIAPMPYFLHGAPFPYESSASLPTYATNSTRTQECSD